MRRLLRTCLTGTRSVLCPIPIRSGYHVGEKRNSDVYLRLKITGPLLTAL
jgi:hypothetical protein